jgi:hypothetical protein
MASSVVDYRRKLGLIIGINKYLCNSDSLQYCINDATDLNTTLQRIGFETSLELDCNYNELENKIDEFAKKIERDDLVLFYFAGHGKQNEEENYLLPSDYDYDYRGDEHDYIVNHAINVKYIMKKIDSKKCRITIYLFDCCRLKTKMRYRAMLENQGLGPIAAKRQTLVVFACAPGEATLDETWNNRNGSFIENLLKNITTPDKDIEEIMKKVAGDVNQQTAGVQLPYRTSSLVGEVYLVTKNNPGKDVFFLNSREKQLILGNIIIWNLQNYSESIESLRIIRIFWNPLESTVSPLGKRGGMDCHYGNFFIENFTEYFHRNFINLLVIFSLTIFKLTDSCMCFRKFRIFFYYFFRLSIMIGTNIKPFLFVPYLGC